MVYIYKNRKKVLHENISHNLKLDALCIKLADLSSECNKVLNANSVCKGQVFRKYHVNDTLNPGYLNVRVIKFEQ